MQTLRSCHSNRQVRVAAIFSIARAGRSGNCRRNQRSILLLRRSCFRHLSRQHGESNLLEPLLLLMVLLLLLQEHQLTPAVGASLVSLDLVALHEGRETWLAAHEELVTVAAFVLPIRDSLKVVEIQLTLETAEVSHAKVLGHHLLSKLLGFVNVEGPSASDKGSDVRLIAVLEVDQHLVELAREGARVPFRISAAALAAVARRRWSQREGKIGSDAGTGGALRGRETTPACGLRRGGGGHLTRFQETS